MIIIKADAGAQKSAAAPGESAKRRKPAAAAAPDIPADAARIGLVIQPARRAASMTVIVFMNASNKKSASANPLHGCHYSAMYPYVLVV